VWCVWRVCDVWCAVCGACGMCMCTCVRVFMCVCMYVCMCVCENEREERERERERQRDRARERDRVSLVESKNCVKAVALGLCVVLIKMVSRHDLTRRKASCLPGKMITNQRQHSALCMQVW